MRYAILALLCLAAAMPAAAAPEKERRMERMVGLYIHQHWPYNHPYAARTWTREDWCGFAAGLKRIGYNTLLIWPMLETMPDPPTPSDRAQIAKLARVIDYLHNELQMRVYFAFCPNVSVDDAEASRATVTKRHFFYCDTRVDPGDPAAVERMLRRREEQLRPLRAVDGVSIIDSDPGGWPGSTNEQFVQLLGAYRKMFDRIRPGIELIYWMHAGWEAYGRFYATGRFAMGTDAEQEDALARLKARNPEPWGVANGLPYAEKLGIADRVIRFNYGLIEGEPSFPLTNFGGRGAYEAGAAASVRGVMGNAQTHFVQLPNIFAFARGAHGQPLEDADYQAFAEELIPGLGPEILAGWKAIGTDDAPAMRAAAKAIEARAATRPAAGPLAGLLFRDPARFLKDLGLQLRMKAARAEFCADAEAGRPLKASLGRFARAARAWQRRHGYRNFWWDGRLYEALHRVGDPALEEVLGLWRWGDAPFEHHAGATPFERVKTGYRILETSTPRLIEAMERAARTE